MLNLNFDEKIGTALIMFAISALAGAAIIRIGASGRKKSRERLEQERKSCTARVVDVISELHRYGRNSSHRVWYPVVQFRAEGKDHCLVNYDGMQKDQYAVGDTVEIRYDEADPEHFHFVEWETSDDIGNGHMIRMGIIWIAVSAVVALILAFVL